MLPSSHTTWRSSASVKCGIDFESIPARCMPESQCYTDRRNSAHQCSPARPKNAAMLSTRFALDCGSLHAAPVPADSVLPLFACVAGVHKRGAVVMRLMKHPCARSRREAKCQRPHRLVISAPAAKRLLRSRPLAGDNCEGSVSLYAEDQWPLAR